MNAFLAHMAQFDAHVWVNVAIAVLGAFVAFGAVNRMTPETECTIIISFATVGVGLTAWAIGSVSPSPEWVHAYDTLLLGGVVALIIGTRRRTIWIQPRWMPLLSISVSGVTWLAFFATV